MKKITGKTNLGELVSKHPETVNVFFEHGMHCIGCALAAFETVEEGARAHGIDVEKLVEDLNKIVNKKSKQF
ncbi:MAG: disulfide oxidoreductase [Candidatus Aenigmatarchaeota archaeon]|nr:MAG: disulfide oxidoreductase [Candidatus Aenigmarchaeota archaeon]RLJ08854.1 MAG: disulfide oxidoreductase [Candidatus Aenigmarchaeota archaeon]RLJ09343.1 MAG: disulfide oxidoreductase [Candidatus Aenigmarchaeota archaeon]